MQRWIFKLNCVLDNTFDDVIDTVRGSWSLLQQYLIAWLPTTVCMVEKCL